MVRRFQPNGFVALVALAALIGGSGCSSGYYLPDGGVVGGGIGGLGGVNNPQNDGGSDGGIVDAGDDGGMADSGCSPESSVTGCYGLGQTCQPAIYLNGGCVSSLVCYMRIDPDAGETVTTCCDFSTGVYQC